MGGCECVYSKANQQGKQTDPEINRVSTYTPRSSLALRQNTREPSSLAGSEPVPEDRHSLKMMDYEAEFHLSELETSDTLQAGTRSTSRAASSTVPIPKAMNPINAAMNPNMGTVHGHGLSPRKTLMSKPYEQWLVPD